MLDNTTTLTIAFIRSMYQKNWTTLIIALVQKHAYSQIILKNHPYHIILIIKILRRK